jgi:hypothetical protein
VDDQPTVTVEAGLTKGVHGCHRAVNYVSSCSGCAPSGIIPKRLLPRAQELGATSVDIQHPATATWYNDVDDVTSMFDPTDPDFSDKAKYMQANECCVMQVGPDGKARAVRLDLQGSSFVDKNNYFLNYVGRYMASAP